MATYRIKHITRYTYTAPVVDSANQIMLYPVTDQLQEVEYHNLHISNSPQIEVYDDYFGNKAGLFTIITPHNELNIISEIKVETYPVNNPHDTMPPEDQWNHLALISDVYTYQDFLIKETFDQSNELHAEVNRLLNRSLSPFNIVQDMSSFVYNQFAYKKGITSVETKLEEVWKLRAGVCQEDRYTI